LDKIPDFRGTVYRASGGFNYNLEQGKVIEWNQFISTSRSREKIWNFLAKEKKEKNIKD
jgi:hypothetical protein